MMGANRNARLGGSMLCCVLIGAMMMLSGCADMLDPVGMSTKGAAFEMNGTKEFCGDPEFPCEAGEGDCDDSNDCAQGLVCRPDVGRRFKMDPTFDVCVPLHCYNGIQDEDEEQVDCGGAACGKCLRIGANGQGTFCDDPAFPCDVGEGDCDADLQCGDGLVCKRDIGAKFHMRSDFDVCMPAHCVDGIISGDETDVDCGGTCDPCMSTPAPGGIDQVRGMTPGAEAGE